MSPASTTRYTAALLSAATFAGCAGPIVGIEKVQSIPFIEAEHGYVLAAGTASIAGRAWIQSAEARITCEGTGARLFPVTEFTSERMTIIYGGANDGFRPAHDVLVFKNEPAEFKKYFKATSCDQEGRFRFEGLAAGDYYVITGAISKMGTHALDHGYLMKQVTAAEGSQTDVELHR